MAAAYFATGQIGFLLGSGYHLGAPIWLPAGVGIAAVLLLGDQVWPGLALGSIIIGVTWLWRFAPTPLTLAGASLCLAWGNTLEALAAGWCIRRFANGSDTFRQPQSILFFVASAAGCCLIMGAVGGTAACQIVGLFPVRSIPNLWFSLWLGRLMSAIVLTPLIVVWSRRRLPPFDLKRAMEAGLLLVLAVVLCELVFGNWFQTRPTPAPLVFLVIPALLWTALSFGQRGTTGVAFIIAIVATAATLRGRGPFALADRELSLLLLENFVAVITVMSLILAADVRQRQSIEGQLRASEQRYRDLFERNPQPVWVCDYETLRFLAVNEAAVQHYGYSRPEFLRMTLADLMPAGTGDGVADALARASRGEELHQEWQHRTKEGALIQVEITARNLIFDQRPAAVMLSNDITERKRAERQTTAFSELGRRLSAARSPRETAQIVMGTADALFGWEACLFELYSKEQNDLTPVLCIDTINGKRTDVTSDCDHPGPGAHAREALQQGARLILRQDPPTFGPDMHPFGDKSRPSASLMFAPVRKEREAIAVLSIQSYIPNRYNEADLRLFQSLADHCASALERIAAEEELLHLNSELENRVRQRTAQLEAINKELEAFSYSVSHDLRAPLRSIRGFSDVLLERYAAKLDSRGQEFLRRACESSHQMDRLIEDLLKLSRVGRSELQHQDVNLSALAESVVVELRQSEPKRKARFVVAPGLQAQGDERLLRIVLENLLRNAWKFTSKLSESLIEVGFVSPQEAFFVRDNGAGFDMAYASKLFGVFQRLHSTTDFPGTGVGLATVQRIINRHGGRVWVEAAVDKGATFYFTLGQEDRL